MTPTTSRRLRKMGLALVSIGFLAVWVVPVLFYSAFGRAYHVYMPFGMIFGGIGFWLGIGLYVWGRFQYRP